MPHLDATCAAGTYLLWNPDPDSADRQRLLAGLPGGRGEPDRWFQGDVMMLGSLTPGIRG